MKYQPAVLFLPSDSSFLRNDENILWILINISLFTLIGVKAFLLSYLYIELCKRISF